MRKERETERRTKRKGKTQTPRKRVEFKTIPQEEKSEIPMWVKNLTTLFIVSFLGYRILEESSKPIEISTFKEETQVVYRADVDISEQLSGFDPAVAFWAPKILQWEERYGVDRLDIATLMQIESCGNPFAVSTSGAMGLFQVKPEYFLRPGEGKDILFDPDINAERGLVFFAYLVRKSGDLGQAYIGYNAGGSMMGSPIENLSLETQRYLTWSGMRIQAASREPLTVLQEWYKAGGTSLCSEAQEVIGIAVKP